MTLFDMQGKRIFSKHIDKLQNETQTLDISDKTEVGQYLILIQSKGLQTERKFLNNLEQL